MDPGARSPPGDRAILSSDDDLVRSLRSDRLRRWLDPDASYQLTRYVFLRLLGLIYFVAFFSLSRQVDPLLGEQGLLPAQAFVDRISGATGSPGAAFWKLPTLFLWTGASDAALHAACWAGTALSLAVMAGATNAILQLFLWALYLSLVHVGQVFYGYGWEIQLLETGFLAIFLCPVARLSPYGAPPPPRVLLWLLRWLIFRIMLGAGLIKLRGDPCWSDLTCLVYHYETQPIPNPLSYYLHRLPRPAHAAGVLVNHLVELVAPWFAFCPRRARHAAGAAMVVFQVFLILSGNLSFLNWLTIAPAIACFDDTAIARILPGWLAARIREGAPAEPSRWARRAAIALAVVVIALSVNPVANLFSTRQAMNTSFDPFALVNTYGAFGSVGRERFEVILEGTLDAVPDERARWMPYELPCKPGDVRRAPCVVSPYHYRLDWQIWFAAQSTAERQPWLVHLTYKLLRGDRGVKGLFAVDPFPDRPPRYVRAELYRYELTGAGEGSGAWWRRSRVGAYFRPLSVEDRELLRFLAGYGWRGE